MVRGIPVVYPPLIEDNRREDCLHVFLIHNPVAIIMAMMIVDAYQIPFGSVRVVGIRHTSPHLTGFQELPLIVRAYDRYVNRFTGRNLAAWRLCRKYLSELHYIVYASWVYSEVEELLSSNRSLGLVVFEEGQQSYYQSPPYRPDLFNRWLFRRNQILRGSISHYFRNDTSAYVSLTTEAFPLMPRERRYVLSNLESVAQNYAPRLKGIAVIGLMPAPRRLTSAGVFPAIDKLIDAVQGQGVIKMHPGYLSEKFYVPSRFAKYINERSGGRIDLCPDDVLIELEMLVEKKQLYGARSSLVRYADLLGSSFVPVTFDNYIAPII
jgi:hypothetical protein